jgi:hypothetical protein
MAGKKADSVPPTLADLARHVSAIACTCYDCDHRVSLPLAGPIDAHGAEKRFPALLSRFRCAACGSRNVDARPDWPDPLSRKR